MQAFDSYFNYVFIECEKYYPSNFPNIKHEDENNHFSATLYDLFYFLLGYLKATGKDCRVTISFVECFTCERFKFGKNTFDLCV